jgi:hypothetical protein
MAGHFGIDFILLTTLTLVSSCLRAGMKHYLYILTFKTKCLLLNRPIVRLVCSFRKTRLRGFV